MTHPAKIILILAFFAITASALGYGGYYFYELSQYTSTIEQELTQTKTELASTTKNLGDYLEVLEHERNTLKLKLLEEQARLNLLAAQIAGITDVVGTLEKLNELDPELLKKIFADIFFK